MKGSVGHQMKKLRFSKKRHMTDLLLMQLASYRHVLTRKIKYQLYVLTDFIYKPIFLVLFFDTSTLFSQDTFFVSRYISYTVEFVE